MSTLRSIAVAASMLLGSTVFTYAQTPATPPAGMTQEQFDSLVDAISNLVAEKLKAEGVLAKPQPKTGKGAPPPKPRS